MTPTGVPRCEHSHSVGTVVEQGKDCPVPKASGVPSQAITDVLAKPPHHSCKEGFQIHTLRPQEAGGLSQGDTRGSGAGMYVQTYWPQSCIFTLGQRTEVAWALSQVWKGPEGQARGSGQAASLCYQPGKGGAAVGSL